MGRRGVLPCSGKVQGLGLARLERDMVKATLTVRDSCLWVGIMGENSEPPRAIILELPDINRGGITAVRRWHENDMEHPFVRLELN